MTDVEKIILSRLDSIESKVMDLTDFKSKIMGIVIAISGVGTVIGSIIVTAVNHIWK